MNVGTAVGIMAQMETLAGTPVEQLAGAVVADLLGHLPAVAELTESDFQEDVRRLCLAAHPFVQMQRQDAGAVAQGSTAPHAGQRQQQGGPAPQSSRPDAEDGAAPMANGSIAAAQRRRAPALGLGAANGDAEQAPWPTSDDEIREEFQADGDL